MRAHRDAFFDALASDFNTPAALAALFSWVREANSRGQGVGDGELREMLSVLGLENLLEVVGDGADAEIDEDALSLLRERERARAARDFATADAMREQLRARGFEIRDGPDGPQLIRPLER
jgi:cysteinyl-tRNA synthetase